MLSAAVFFVANAGARSDPVIYDVDVNPGLESLRVHACFPPPEPEALYAIGERPAAYLTRFSVNGRDTGLPRAVDARIALARASGDTCVEYTVDLREARAEKRHPLLDVAPHSAVLLQAGAWLWRPEQDPAAGLHLRIHLPEDVLISAPWPLVSSSAKTLIYDLTPTPFDWPALTAFGRMSERRVAVPGAELRLSMLDATSPPDYSILEAWVREGAMAVAGAYGRFPIPSPQILVVPVGPSEETVPWGQVLRGGGPAAHLFVDHTRSPEQLRKDWVLVHELSHMLHPNLHGDGMWLAEGLATYYQNVLRARSGALDEREAWLKLHQGFERGIGQTRRGVTLANATRNMMRDRIYMRVYWSGTAVSLLADVALRGRGSSLDQALSEFGRCCLEEARIWTAAEFLEKLDTLTGGGLADLYRRYIDSDQFPDLAGVYRELGLIVKPDGLELSGDEEAARLRRAIMGAPATPG